MPKKAFNVFREDHLHVVKPMCATCIYRKSNESVGARVRAHAVAHDNIVVCHSTLGSRPRANAVCAGFFAKEQTDTLQIAKALGVVKFVPPLSK